MNPDQEDRITEAMEQLRISYTMGEWCVCSLFCESVADEFKHIAEKQDSAAKD